MSASTETLPATALADELRVLITAKGLDASGGVVNYVSSLMSQFPDSVRCEHLQVGREPSRRRLARDLFFPLADNLRIINKNRALNPHCVHLNPSFNVKAMLRDGALLTTLRLIGQHRVVVFFHGWDEALAGRVVKSGWRRLLFRWVFGWPPVTFVLASSFRESLIAMGMPPQRIQVTTTMFDGEIFNDIRRRREDDDELRLIFMSRFVAAKGVYEAVHAFATLAKEHEGLRLVMLGDGPERAALEAEVQRRDLSDRVEFAGYVRGPAKAQALVDADVFLFPTYYGEGCPVVLLEAMAAGLPVITHRAGGIPDIFVDGKNGILLEKVDDASVTEALGHLLAAPEARTQMGAYNREEAWAQYEAAVVSQRMLEAYRELS